MVWSLLLAVCLATLVIASAQMNDAVVNMEVVGCDFSDPVYSHLRQREGFKLTGYIPTALSGVTIATGIDLGQQDESRLRSLGVPATIIAKVRPYLGLKTRAEVLAHGLRPENLHLSQDEACLLDAPFLAEAKNAAKPYSAKMTIRGFSCLVSLHHWAGRLGNTQPDGKLCVKLPGGIVKNFVWSAIKDGSGTDTKLIVALEETKLAHFPGTSAYNRLKHEIGYMEGHEP